LQTHQKEDESSEKNNNKGGTQSPEQVESEKLKDHFALTL
jgi:hypothetical protein